MRIEGPRSTDGVRKSDRARKTGGASSDFKSFLDADTEETTGPSSAPALGGVGSLIAAQGFEDPAEKKSRGRMMERASRVLDALDGVHRGLLNGNLSTTELEQVTRSVSAQREKIADPRLLSIMDDVDLRAQVEMAKLEMARDKVK